MKRLTRELLIIYAIGLVVSPLVGILTYSFAGSWELGAVAGIVAFACFVRASSSSYYAYRGNPEYQKDVKDKD